MTNGNERPSLEMPGRIAEDGEQRFAASEADVRLLMERSFDGVLPCPLSLLLAVADGAGVDPLPILLGWLRIRRPDLADRVMLRDEGSFALSSVERRVVEKLREVGEGQGEPVVVDGRELVAVVLA
jgi:hypothetical protein